MPTGERRLFDVLLGNLEIILQKTVGCAKVATTTLFNILAQGRGSNDGLGEAQVAGEDLEVERVGEVGWVDAWRGGWIGVVG